MTTTAEPEGRPHRLGGVAATPELQIGYGEDPDLGPAVLYQFPTLNTTVAVVGLDDDDLDVLAAQTAHIVERVKARRAGGPALEEPPPPPPVHCPGCNRRLFGEVAERGGCFECWPTFPPNGATIDPKETQ